MEPFLTITDQVALTPFQAGDKANMLLYLNDPILARNTLRVPHPYTPQDADNYLLHLQERYKTIGAWTDWAIRHRDHGLIGSVGSFYLSGADGHYDELGYWLAAPFRGQGLMTAVLRLFSDHLFATRPPLVRLQAFVFSFNEASVRVLEKASFQREGYVRKLYCKNGELIDAILMARIK
jgi:ribosomal-protein-alanine N-acetyltransferase